MDAPAGEKRKYERFSESESRSDSVRRRQERREGYERGDDQERQRRTTIGRERDGDD